MAEHVFLVGMMGSGKSSSDAEIERLTGRTVAQIFAERGEAAFRAQETAFVARAATSDTPAVVAVGGGSVMDSDNRQRMKQGGTVVWIRARDETLVDRVGSGDGRPLLGSDPAESVRRLHVRRRPLYAGISDVVVDVDSLTPAEIADRVVAALHRRRAKRARDPAREA